MRWLISAPFGNTEVTFIFDPNQHDALVNFQRFLTECDENAQEFGIENYSVDVYPRYGGEINAETEKEG